MKTLELHGGRSRVLGWFVEWRAGSGGGDGDVEGKKTVLEGREANEGEFSRGHRQREKPSATGRTRSSSTIFSSRKLPDCRNLCTVTNSTLGSHVENDSDSNGTSPTPHVTIESRLLNLYCCVVEMFGQNTYAKLHRRFYRISSSTPKQYTSHELIIDLPLLFRSYE